MFNAVARSLTLLAALSAVSASVLVERHTPSSCSGAAADSTRKCTVKSGECCPADWACVVPADGTEVCLQNAKSSVCPPGYAVKSNVCVLAATGSAGSASTATSGGSAVTSVVTVTSTSLSTSFSTSGSATVPVTIPVPITTTETTVLQPTSTVVPSVSVSTSFSTSGSATIGVPVNVTLSSTATGTATLSVSTSLSVSGSATIPVNVTVSNSAGTPVPTEPGNGAAPLSASAGGFAALAGAALAALFLA